MTRVDPIAILLAGCGLASCTDRVADDANNAAACDVYLDCLSAIDVETFEQELGVYGRNGSCLAQSSAATCDEVCRARLEEIGSDDAACQLPPDPPVTDTDTDTDTDTETDTATSGDPVPADDGSIACGDIGPGAPTVAGGPLGPTGFPKAPCNPRAVNDGGTHTCCSDDPAAVAGELPAYQGKGISGGTPIFSGLNNELGTSGLCVNTSDIPMGSGLAEPVAANCPIPCNPTWAVEEVQTVCGQARLCCQTRELQASDCILDSETWRPATGADIPAFTNWAQSRHVTHQDPGGSGCQMFGGEIDSAEFNDCVAQLSVADQRGFCMAFGPGQACPLDAPGYLNACDQINAGLIPPPE